MQEAVELKEVLFLRYLIFLFGEAEDSATKIRTSKIYIFERKPINTAKAI